MSHAHRCLIALVCTGLFAELSKGDESLVGDSSLHFASLDEGRTLVSTSDTFTKALSRFDLQVRFQTTGAVTEKELLTFLTGEVVAWDEATQQAIVESIGRLRPRLLNLRLPLPGTVTLIHMSGKDEANAAYTRGSAILLPRDRLRTLKTDGLDRLLVHELFHVLSRSAPELRRELYKIIGFEVCEPISPPSALAELKLTNPDAPLIDCQIELKEGEETFHAAPLLYSSANTYDAATKPSLFKYLTFRLMKVEFHEGRWQPVLKDGEPILIEPRSSKSFADQIGQNTNYIIHPDEILADNFVHLVMQTEKLASPRIVERMGELLRKK